MLAGMLTTAARGIGGPVPRLRSAAKPDHKKRVAAKSIEKRVLRALPVGVDLDLAQVTSAAKLMPSQTRPVLRRLVEEHAVEVVREEAIAGRPRYRRRAS
jgi:predicted ArsR family transcriptional regulator